ncbi:MAG: hypothetical protein GX442_02235 [Candidatus Riflebacteria bacterium]|nr:hypothetical protein [Candidatus Riflebacteria bacterium]
MRTFSAKLLVLFLAFASLTLMVSGQPAIGSRMMEDKTAARFSESGRGTAASPGKKAVPGATEIPAGLESASAVEEPVSSREALENRLRLEALRKAMEGRQRETLRTEEKRKIFLGQFGPRRRTYREKDEDPGEISAVDERKIERTLGTDLEKEAAVEPFGRSFFLKGEDISGSLENVAAPSSYILGPGDSLKIIIWSEMGDETVYDVTVNPEGQVYIPILGVMGVSGQTVGQFQETVIGSLSGKFQHFKGQVTLSKIRTLQIFLAGEVRKPGAMVVSALATAFHALYRAGGPTDRGSMRQIRVLRGSVPVSEIDLYEYFLHGDKSQDVTLESGDTIFVPPLGERVTVQGEVVRPAIYELLGEKTLAEVLTMAGGIDATAYTGRVRVARWQGGGRRKISDVGAASDSGAMAAFRVANGDEILVERATEEVGNRVIVQGAVVRPGEYAVAEGTTLSAVLAKAGGITAEAAKDIGQIIRKLDQGREEILSFNLAKVLAKGAGDDLPVKPYDRVRVFFASEIKADIRSVTIAGAVRRPGEYILREKMTVRDLLLRAQGLTADAAGEGEVASAKSEGRGSEVRRIDLEKVLRNPRDPDNILLAPLDKVNVFVRGDVLLEPEVVVLTGEVKRPGPYALKRKGETLSEVIARAGGLTSRAFPEGAVFQRKTGKVAPLSQIEAADKVRGELFDQAALDLRADLLRAGAKLEAAEERTPDKTLGVKEKEAVLGSGTTDVAAGLETSQAAVRETSRFGDVQYANRSMLQDLVRIPIRLEAVLAGKGNWGANDVVLEDGDQITIPVIPCTVSVVGAVVNPTTLLFEERNTPRSYIERAGGFSEHSNHRRTVVVRPNGEVVPLRRVRHIQRGDIILVPPRAKLVRKDKLAESSQVAQILGNLAVMYKVVTEAQ